MRKMIDSGVEWLGAIPQDWDLVQIKSIASCKSEKAPTLAAHILVWNTLSLDLESCWQTVLKLVLKLILLFRLLATPIFYLENCAPILRRLQSLISTDNAPPKFLC